MSCTLRSILGANFHAANWCSFLADRILTVALMLQCTTICLSPFFCDVKRCVLWEQKLLLCWQPIGSRIWEIDWYQNEWPWPLFRGRIEVMSNIASHSPLNLNISQTAQRNRKWHMVNEMATWRDRWRYVTPKGQTRDPLYTLRGVPISRKQLEMLFCNYR